MSLSDLLSNAPNFASLYDSFNVRASELNENNDDNEDTFDIYVRKYIETDGDINIILQYINDTGNFEYMDLDVYRLICSDSTKINELSSIYCNYIESLNMLNNAQNTLNMARNQLKSITNNVEFNDNLNIFKKFLTCYFDYRNNKDAKQLPFRYQELLDLIVHPVVFDNNAIEILIVGCVNYEENHRRIMVIFLDLLYNFVPDDRKHIIKYIIEEIITRSQWYTASTE